MHDVRPLITSSFVALSSFHLAIAEQPSDADAVASSFKVQCFVRSIHEAQIAAKEAGVIVSLDVHEAELVKKGQLLARIDDELPRKQMETAKLEYALAKKQAEDDLDVRLAKKSADVTRAEYDAAMAAHQKVPDSIPRNDRRRRKFVAERSVLEIERSQRDFEVAQISAQIAESKIKEASLQLRRRRVEAPFDGIVMETYHDEGEWLSPGDPVVRVVRMDRLRVDGFIDATQYAPHELVDLPVTVQVHLPGGKTVRFESAITFATPEVLANDSFRVSAEIENPVGQGHFVIPTGVEAEMIVAPEIP